DRDDGIADRDVARVRELERLEQGGGSVDLDDSEIRRLVAPDELRLVARAVPESHRDRVRPRDDVLVGDDVAVLVVDEARSLSLLLLVAERGSGCRVDGDLDDGLVRLAVDLTDRERTRRDGGLCPADRHLPDDGRAVVPERRESDRTRAHADGESGD